jgi:long-chain-fatty-acid--CoA ligase ACSBG
MELNLKFDCKNANNNFFSQVLSAIQKGIDRANEHAVSNAARVQRWTILPTDISVAGGELGPTLKLKRFYFNQKYEQAIEKLYE